MKRKILSALAAFTALVFASCSMGNTIENQNNTDDKTACVTIGLNEISRTALPGVDSEDDFDSFTLTGREIPPEGSGYKTYTETLGSWSTDESQSAYAKMTSEKFAVCAGYTYTFTLTATKGGATWQGTVTKTMETGTNSLSFKLKIASLSDQGTGAINVTLTVPDAVKAVEAVLCALDEETSVPFDSENPPLTFENLKATFTQNDIPAGNYVLVYTLYGDTEKTLKLGTWREYAGITGGVTSSSNPVIKSNDDLAQIYTITLNLNGGELTGTFPGSYTRYSLDEYEYGDIDLPNSAINSDYINISDEDEVEIYKKNCFFEGWYDAETDGKQVYCIDSDMMGDITVWAHWTDTLTLDYIDNIYNEGVDRLKNYLNLQLLLEKGFTQINLKLKDMADLKEPAEDWSFIDFTSGDDASNTSLSKLMEYTDPRFAAILDAICAVKGDIGAHVANDSNESESYSGIAINLDLSETSLTYLPFTAFADMSGSSNFASNLVEITLPETLTAILPYTFVQTGITEITIPKNVNYMYSPFMARSGITIDFESGSKLETIEVLGGESTPIAAITIPASVKEIKDGAFFKSGLKQVTFEERSNLETIGKEAFYFCNITSITLPATLKTISDNAFDACSKLETINFEGTCEQWAAITRGNDWHESVKATTVKCSDYTVPLDLSPADFEGLIGTKPASIAKEVGDIVFSDGSAIPYTEDLELTETQKANAVAVIFYKGTGLNSGNDKTTCRTLGVGFNINNDGLEWCSCDASAYELSIDTIKCRPKDSNYWCLLFSDATANDKNGSDNLEQIAEFLTANDKDVDTDDSSNYPAFYFAKNYDAPGSAFDSGWYLPSLAEFNELIYAIFTDTDIDINDVLRLVINEEAPINYLDNQYWTSTQSSDDVIEAYFIYKERGTIYYANEEKSYTCCTCAIREF